MGRTKAVNLDALGRICEKLDCSIGDLVDFVKNEEQAYTSGQRDAFALMKCKKMLKT